MLKRLAIFLLDGADAVSICLSGLDALCRAGVQVELWADAADIALLDLISPKVRLHVLDARIHSTEPLQPWWPEAFSEVLTFKPDNILVVANDISLSCERLCLLFPATRLTIWVRSEISRSEHESADLDAFRAVVDSFGDVAHRLGIPDHQLGRPWPDDQDPELSSADLAARGIGQEPFLVADLTGLFVDEDDEVEWARALAFTLENARFGSVILPVGSDNANERVARKLGEFGFRALTISRPDLTLRLLQRLADRSAGFVGVDGPAFRAACAFDRPVVVLSEGLDWRRRMPTVTQGAIFASELPIGLITGSACRVLDVKDVLPSLDRVLVRNASGVTVHEGLLHAPRLRKAVASLEGQSQAEAKAAFLLELGDKRLKAIADLLDG